LKNQICIRTWILRSIAAPALLITTLAAGQARPPAPVLAARPARPVASAGPALVPNDRDVATTQRELIKLLRLSPTLTTVVSHDPSLLGYPDYVNRNNPQLGQFLAVHPEVVRNPEFYLFTHMDQQDGNRDEALERAVWPELVQPRREDTFLDSDFAKGSLLLLGFACFLGMLVWLIRLFVRSRRWGRIFKLQSEIHGKLIDKLSSGQELAAYMNAEAGKRFLEGAPIPAELEPEHRVPGAAGQLLFSLQIGIVLVLIGLGLFGIHLGVTGKQEFRSMEIPVMVLNYLAMMTGLGFILSAGVSWFLAKRLGLIPEGVQASSEPGVQHQTAAQSDALFDPRERQ
jgi:hypothetical protein